MEPFAGMLSILLNRRPVDIEIMNDANGNIVNYWRVLRDRPGELERKLELTPWAKEEYLHCCANAEEGDDVERARKFVVRVAQGMLKSDKQNSWILITTGNFVRGYMMLKPGQIKALAERIKALQIDAARDACDFLERIFEKNWVKRELLIYCDPPYQVESSDDVYTKSLDFERMKDILRNAPEHAKIAISGYPGDYDDLGWRLERKKVKHFSAGPRTGERPDRLECLWMNYDDESLPLLQELE